MTCVSSVYFAEWWRELSIDALFDTYNFVGDGTDFNAALFDRGGLY